MTKRAVVIGVNDYSVQGFGNLGGCVRDAQAMYHLLVDAFTFDPSQVWLYTDANATSERILQAITYMLKQSEPGDVACLYYAGHGGLHPMTDNAYYQTIIPYSGRFITDWDLWAAADQLQQSVVNFTVVLDSCHSGGMHEESEPEAVRTVRLAEEMIQRIVAGMHTVGPFGVTAPGIEAYQNNVSNVLAAEGGVCYSEDVSQQFIAAAKSTLLAACRWDEYAGETSNHGYLTQAILDTVNASGFTMDHQAFHKAVESKVHEVTAKQTPQLRGQENRMAEAFLQPWTDSR
jgi:hypothetical protein